ncbi:MAG TPA: hypothetical protein VNA16_04545, partial [Abditibacteriaceae bacterium]|nr:hypothetical protein [Abditibacteriaceae bacterium]
MPNLSRALSHRPDSHRLNSQRRHWTRLHRLRAGVAKPRQWRPSRPTLLLAPLVFVAIILLIGRRYALQRLDIEGTVRHQLIPQLEKQFGTSIEVGRIESDWLSRVILRDVVIGRDEKLPLGALLRVKTAILNIDLISLALHRTEPLNALSKASLLSPQLYLERDTKGQLNWLNLFKQKFTGDGARWAGLVEVRDGRVWYRDDTVRSASGRFLLADATGVQATVRFNGNAPLTFEGNVVRALVGPQKIPLYNLAATGSAEPQGRWLVLDARWPAATAALLVDYGFPKRDVVARSGTIGGRAQISFDATAPRTQRWLVAGAVTLREVSGYAQALQDPTTKQPLLLERITGPVAFNNRTFSTSGLSLATLNSPLRVTGKFALLGRAATNPTRPEPPVFDLTLYSASADTMRLARLAQAKLNGVVLTGGRARGTLHLAGDMDSMRVDGNLTIPRFALRHPLYGSMSTPLLRVVLAADGDAQHRRINADLKTAGVVAQHPRWGLWRAGAAHGVVLATGSTQSGHLQVRLAAPHFSAAPPGAGVWQAQLLRGVVRADGSFNAPRLRADLTAPGFSVRHTKWGEGRAASLRAVIAAHGNPNKNQFRLALTAPGFDARLPRWGTARVELLNATIAGSGALRSPRVASNIRLTGFRLRSPRYGQARGQALRVIASSKNAVRAPWLGEVRFTDVDASALNIAALAPSIAQRVRDVGTLVGRARFAGLQAGATPVVRGALHLSRATVEGVRLRDLTAQISLDQNELRLAGGRAHSEFGLLLADVGANLRSKATRLALTAPNVVVAASRINPFLAGQGLAFGGVAKGRISVSTASTAPNTFETRFTLNSPLGTLQFLDGAGRARGAAKARAPRLEGSGAVRLGPGSHWRFVGTASLVAQSASFGSAGQSSATGRRKAALPPLLQPLSGSWGSALRLAVRGSVTRTASGVEPRLAGEVSLAQLVVPNPGASTAPATAQPDLWLPLENTSAVFVVNPQRIEVPRLFTHLRDDFGGGKISGHLTLQRDAARAFFMAGQLLADKLDAARLARLIPNEAVRATQPTGIALARADFEGTLQNMGAAVEARLYNGSIRVKDGVLPVDAARADFEVQLPEWRAIPVRELVVWSRGGRATLSGTITRAESTPAGSTLDLDAKINDVRLRDATATLLATAPLNEVDNGVS